jgi:branched-chain amino acid transport system permease protein
VTGGDAAAGAAVAAPAVAVRSSTRTSRAVALVAAGVVAFLASMPLWAVHGIMRTLIGFFTLLALAQMWNLLAGYAGLVSIGQQAYVGLGAYGLILFADVLGVNVWLAVVLAALAGALLSLPIAGLAFRLRGGYFAIGTWVIAEAIRLAVSNWGVLGRGTGTTLRAVSGIDRDLRLYLTYLLALAVGVGSVVTVRALLLRRVGLALTASRDSESAAGSLGVDVGRARLLVYVVAAFGCALAGAVIYLNLLRVQPDAAFSVTWTAYVIFVVVIGGVGTIEGPIVGTVLFYVLQQTLARYGAWYLILLGLVAIAAMVWAPRGLWGAVTERFGLELFPVRRRLRLPDRPPERGG